MISVEDKTEDIINIIWNRDEYYIVAAGEDALSRKEVEEFAEKYGVKLPEEYISHATGHWSCPYLEIREEIWPRHKSGDAGPFWSFLYGVFVYAYSKEAPDWMQIEIAAEEFKDMGHQILPILKVIGDADVYCFDSNGNIKRWLHEGDSFESFEGNFFDLLEYEFRQLEERRIKKKAEQANATDA